MFLKNKKMKSSPRLDVLQQFIGRLYVDTAFLELFTNCQTIALKLADLEEEEINFLKNTDIQKIRKINDIIREKRLNVLKNCFSFFSKFYSNTFSSLGNEFLKISRNYSSDRSGKLEMCQDFCSFISQKMEGFKQNNFPKYLKDLVLFEYLSKSCANIHVPRFLKYFANSGDIEPSAKPVFHNYVLMQRFRYPIMDVVNSLKQKKIPKNLQMQECTIIFVPHGNKFNVLQVSDDTYLLIDFLNGEYRVSDLYNMFGKENQERIDMSLEFLSSNNMLLYV